MNEAASTMPPIRAAARIAAPAGMLPTCPATSVKVGRTSMTIRVDVYREHMPTGEQELATTGTFVFVALDDQNRPRPVPPLADGQDTSSAEPDPEARP